MFGIEKLSVRLDEVAEQLTGILSAALEDAAKRDAALSGRLDDAANKMDRVTGQVTTLMDSDATRRADVASVRQALLDAGSPADHADRLAALETALLAAQAQIAALEERVYEHRHEFAEEAREERSGKVRIIRRCQKCHTIEAETLGVA
jgi:hypothetical protein